METPDTEQVETPTMAGNPVVRLARVITQSARFPGDEYGLGKGEKAALARLDVENIRPHQISALSRALIQADLDPESWQPDTWRRWALIAHGIALAGHNGKDSLGKQLCQAGVSESRVTKLLTARGDAFRQLLPQLLRLLASKETAPNWREFGGLIIHQERNEERAEEIRLGIAGRYFSELAKSKAN
ncbi:type I-E CRISPR-associated protein Cse2/CasB [Thiolapillus sp.]|uniref:type I-E CRISPR-associated protein Cse2/CasB n=4 Tax=Thiolapillus sp. TaxID=2017437 RepID=UPI0025F051C6|nr:type I-E CRISPR-associated protein Cse2/CasB [Thiolapillus sp.]